MDHVRVGQLVRFTREASTSKLVSTGQRDIRDIMTITAHMGELAIIVGIDQYVPGWFKTNPAVIVMMASGELRYAWRGTFEDISTDD